MPGLVIIGEKQSDQIRLKPFLMIRDLLSTLNDK